VSPDTANDYHGTMTSTELLETTQGVQTPSSADRWSSHSQSSIQSETIPGYKSGSLSCLLSQQLLVQTLHETVGNAANKQTEAKT